MTLLRMTARAAQPRPSSVSGQPISPSARQSAGKECPDEAGSKPPSNWGRLRFMSSKRRRGGNSFLGWACVQPGQGRAGVQYWMGWEMGEREREKGRTSRDVSDRVSYRSRLALVISHHAANGVERANERTNERGRSCA
jgi:hypothetical protein